VYTRWREGATEEVEITYVDGFVMPLPKENLSAGRRLTAAISDPPRSLRGRSAIALTQDLYEKDLGD